MSTADQVLTAFGLLLIACALTLLWSGRRTWLIAVAQGLGIQAMVAAVAAAVWVGLLLNDPAVDTPWERVQVGVRALPSIAGGWTAHRVHDEIAPGADAEPEALDALLPIIAGQLALTAAALGARRLRGDAGDEGLVIDIIQGVVTLAVIGNVAMGLASP